MVKREISGTPHAADDGGTYVPPAREDGVGSVLGSQPYLGYQIDGKGLADWATIKSDAGFSYDPDHLNAIATEWDALAQKYSAKIRVAQNLLDVQGPGAEYASAIHAEAVHTTGNAMIAAFQDRQQYCEGQAQKFRETAGQYAKTDDDNRDTVAKTDTPPAGSPF